MLEMLARMREPGRNPAASRLRCARVVSDAVRAGFLRRRGCVGSVCLGLLAVRGISPPQPGHGKAAASGMRAPRACVSCVATPLCPPHSRLRGALRAWVSDARRTHARLCLRWRVGVWMLGLCISAWSGAAAYMGERAFACARVDRLPRVVSRCTPGSRCAHVRACRMQGRARTRRLTRPSHAKRVVRS